MWTWVQCGGRSTRSIRSLQGLKITQRLFLASWPEEPVVVEHRHTTPILVVNSPSKSHGDAPMSKRADSALMVRPCPYEPSLESNSDLAWNCAGPALAPSCRFSSHAKRQQFCCRTPHGLVPNLCRKAGYQRTLCQ